MKTNVSPNLFHIPNFGKPLKNNWYIAEFEDGYSTGTMLLSYSVTKGIISWRPLEIILD